MERKNLLGEVIQLDNGWHSAASKALFFDSLCVHIHVHVYSYVYMYVYVHIQRCSLEEVKTM